MLSDNTEKILMKFVKNFKIIPGRFSKEIPERTIADTPGSLKQVLMFSLNEFLGKSFGQNLKELLDILLEEFHEKPLPGFPGEVPTRSLCGNP